MQKTSASHSDKKHFSPWIGLLFLALFAAAVGCYLIVDIRRSEYLDIVQTLSSPPAITQVAEDRSAPDGKSLERFTSENDFKKYLTDSGSLAESSGVVNDLYWQKPTTVVPDGVSADKNKSNAVQSAVSKAPPAVKDKSLNQDSQNGTIAADWFSWTADELGGESPDMAKSDAVNIYLSPDDQYFYQAKSKATDVSTFSARQATTGKTNIISAVPPKDIANVSSVDGHGSILIRQNILAVFGANQILGYDVSDPGNARQIWKMRLDDNSQLVSARLYSDVLYLVLRSDIDNSNPCPIRPIVDGDNPLLIRCEDVYHPSQNTPVDSTFTAMILDWKTGAAQQTISFVGSAQNTVVYLSPNSLYVTWGFNGDVAAFFSGFLAADGHSLVPDFVAQNITKLQSYDLAARSKTDQISFVLDSYAQSLNDSDRAKFQDDLSARLAAYATDHGRDLDRTAIAKIRLSDFKVLTVGEVPGHPLDANSLNEFDGMLRVAVAVGEVNDIAALDPAAATTNDIYILDNGLQTVGSSLGLGFGQQIGSARFGSDAGYLVTGRDTDPIYLLDLSEVSNPKLAGKIDLPGDASYMYELSPTKILVVSKDKWKTRLSLFDVSLASDPKLLDKYSLDEYWTDSDGSHQAFWQDPSSDLLFVAAAKTGYIFSYGDDKLTLKKTITGVTASRVIGINNYLYLVGDERIIVVDIATLEKVARLDVK